MNKIAWVTFFLMTFTAAGRAGAEQTFTLQELLDAPATGVTVGPLSFVDWVESIGVGDPDLITITTLMDDPLNPGLRIDGNGGLFVSGQDVQEDILFGFNIEAISGQSIIKDASLELLGATFSDPSLGRVRIRERIVEFDGLGGFTDLDTLIVEDDRVLQTTALLDSTDFAAQPIVGTVLTITLNSDFAETSTSLDSFTVRFSLVPEPGSVLLGAIALAGFAAVAIGAQRRRRSAV